MLPIVEQALLFRERAARFGLDSPGIVQQGGNGIRRMRPQGDRGEVVHGDDDAKIAAGGPEGADDRADDPMVEVLDRLDLGLGRTLVTGLVRRLEMDEDEVLAVCQGGDGRLRLALVVGVEIAGRPGDVDHRQPGDDPQSLQQVDGADHAAADPKTVLQRRCRRHPPLTPQPDGVGRIFAVADPLPVDRVGGEGDRYPTQQTAPFFIGQIALPVGGDILFDPVVGRDGGEFGVGSPDDDQIAVADPGMEMKGVVGAFPFQGGDQCMALGGGDMAGCKINHGDVVVVGPVEGHEVATERRLVVGQADAHRRGLQRRPAGVIALRRITEQRQIGDIATGREAVGDGMVEEELAVAAQFVDHRRGGDLEGGPASQFSEREIAHAIPHQDQVFH